MMNMVVIMCGFSKMAQQPIHLVVPFHFSEKCFLDMLSPCVVISGGRRFARFDPLRFFFWGYLKAKVYEQRPQTLEALKAIRQEVAAITPEMILKVMDNYQERLHQCINIQGRHLSDVLYKNVYVKQHCVLSRNKNTFAYLLWF